MDFDKKLFFLAVSEVISYFCMCITCALLSGWTCTIFFRRSTSQNPHVKLVRVWNWFFQGSTQTFTARPRIYCSDSLIINWLVLVRFFDSCTATCGTHNSFICLTEGLQLPTTRLFLCASLFSSGAGKAVLEFHHNTAKWENPSLHKSNKGSHPERKVQFFLTFFKNPLAPPPPFCLNNMWWIFLKGF